MSPSKLVNRALVMSSSLIVHAPCSTNHLETTLVHQGMDLLLDAIGLTHPPLPEERCFYVDESVEEVKLFTDIDLIGDILQKGQVRSTRNRRACMIRCMNVDETRGVCKIVAGGVL